MTPRLSTAPSGRLAAGLGLALCIASACAPAAAASTPRTPGAPSSAATRAAPATRALLPADTGVVRVSGAARVDVPSDRARLRFAMETEATSAAQASDDNAARMNAVLAAVRGALADAGTVETSGYGLDPVYNRPEPGAPQRIVGYRVRNEVLVTLDDVDRVGAVLDAAVRAGANRVAELSFFAADTRPARLDAIRQATARAREEAEVLAVALGGALGPVLEVGVSGESPYPQMERFRVAEMAMADTPVEPGSQAVTVTVNITFRLEGR